jgi:hypothetical protein
MALSIVCLLLEMALIFQKTSFLAESRKWKQGGHERNGSGDNFKGAVSEHVKSEGQSPAAGLNVDYVPRRERTPSLYAACRLNLSRPHCKNFHSRVSLPWLLCRRRPFRLGAIRLAATANSKAHPRRHLRLTWCSPCFWLHRHLLVGRQKRLWCKTYTITHYQHSRSKTCIC